MQSCPRAATHTAALLSPAARDDLRAGTSCRSVDWEKLRRFADSRRQSDAATASGSAVIAAQVTSLSLAAMPSGEHARHSQLSGEMASEAPAEVSRYPSQTSGQCPNKFCSALFRSSILSPGYDVDPDISEYQGIASQSDL